MKDSLVWWLIAFETWMVIVWLFRHIAITFVFWRTPKLTTHSNCYESIDKAPSPKISVLMPCKDE